MRIKWAGVILFWAVGTQALAADYELVIPEKNAAIKDAPALVVYSSTLKAGDQIISVRFGGPASGADCQVVGRVRSDGPILADGPEVGQFVGKVYLGEGQPSGKTYAGKLVTVPPGQAARVAAAARARDRDQAIVQPWLIYGGIGIALAFLLLFLKSQSSARSTGGSVVVGPSRRSSVGELIAEMQTKLDSLLQSQKGQPHDGAGSKDFKKRFESLEGRLGRLETSVQSTTQSVAKCGIVLAAVEKRLTEVGETQKALEAKASNIASKFESLHAALAAQTNRENEAINAIFQAIERVRTTAESGAEQNRELSKRIEQLAEIVTAQESKQTATPSDLAALAAALTDLTTRSQTALANLEARIEELRSAFDQLSKRADPAASLDSRLEEISAKFAEVEARLTQLPTEASDFSPLVGQLEALSARFNEVETKLDAQAETTDQLRSILSRIDDIEGRITAQALQSGEEGPPQLIEELSKRILELSDQVASLQGMSDIQTIGNSLEELGGRVAKLQEKVESLASSESQSALEIQLNQLSEQVRFLENAREQGRATTDVPERILEEQPVEPETMEPDRPRLIVEAPESLQPSVRANIESDDLEEPELVTPRSWSAVRGTTEGRCSAEFQRGLKLRSDPKPNLLHPVDAPIGMAPIGAPVAYARRLLYTHGASIRAFWPGREDRTIPLPEPVPTDEWRILAHGSTVYCVGQSSVHVGDLNTWARKTSFDGTYFAQTHTDEHWVGARDDNGQAFLDFRTDRGQPVWPPIALELPSEKLEILSSGARVFAYAHSGEVVRVEGGAAYGAGRFSGQVVRVCRQKDMSLALVRSEKEYKVELLTDLGKVAGTLDLRFEPSSEAFVVMDSRLYLFDKGTKEFVVIDLKKLAEVGRWSSKGVSRVRKLAGIQSGRAHYLAVVAACGEKNTGSAFVVDVKTGQEYKLCEVLEPFVVIIPADVHVAVATRSSYQNIVRVYAPFDLALSDKPSSKNAGEELQAKL